MNKYTGEYLKKTNEELQRSLRSLKNQPGPIPAERSDAIKAVLQERAEGEHEEPVTEYTDHKVEDGDPQTLDERIARKYLSKLNNAKKRGISFSLTLSDIRGMMLKKRCYYTGMELEDDCGAYSPQKRTIERIDPNEGYTKDNTVVCSFVANAMKNVLFEDPASICRISKTHFKAFAAKVLEE